ncbi:MAG: hypothetical protein ACLUSP_05025 [Christensenellales bacterium]
MTKPFQKLKAFYLAFRKQWNTESKPFGFEVQDARSADWLRIEHCADILTDYASERSIRFRSLTKRS